MSGKLIAEAFAGDETAFVAYVAAGDPDFDRCLDVVDVLVESGIDVLELGMPFSDPLADGRANQLASERALAAGMTPWRVLELAREIRGRHPSLPQVMFTYLNPIAHCGDFKVFCRTAADSGIDAMLPLDLPPEEGGEYRAAIDEASVSVVSLVAPNTAPDRIPILAANANAFIYYVCREGVTGERGDFASGVSEKVAEIRRATTLPIVVGFGISTPDHVRAAAATGVDGVVVGSAIVRKVEAIANGEGTLEDLRTFVSGLTAAAH